MSNDFTLKNSPYYQALTMPVNKQLAIISPDGIMRFCVEANNENAINFVNTISNIVRKQITDVGVVQVEQQDTSQTLDEVAAAVKQWPPTQKEWAALLADNARLRDGITKLIDAVDRVQDWDPQFGVGEALVEMEQFLNAYRPANPKAE